MVAVLCVRHDDCRVCPWLGGVLERDRKRDGRHVALGPVVQELHARNRLRLCRSVHLQFHMQRQHRHWHCRRHVQCACRDVPVLLCDLQKDFERCAADAQRLGVRMSIGRDMTPLYNNPAIAFA